MVDYLENIKKPFSDVKTLIIGTILAMIPLVNILVSGYVLKVAEDTVKGKNSLREFAVNDIVDYIIKVILSIVIAIVYMIIPLVLIGIGIGSAFLGALSNPAALSDPTALATTFASALGAGGIFIAIGGLLGLIAAILLPMAMVKWLKAGSVGAAFNIKDVVKSALTSKYIITLIVAFIYSAVVTAVAAALAGLLAITVIVPFIILGLANFITGVSVMSMYAQTV